MSQWAIRRGKIPQQKREGHEIFSETCTGGAATALLTGTCLARETFHGAYHPQGFPDGSIRPDAAVTRAELAEILYRMMEPEQRRELTCTESAFQDVSARHWAYDAICAMAGARLMLGGSDGCFRPDDGVTGEELSIIFERVRAQEPGKKALPELASGWASQEVTFEAGNGWVMGLHGTEFSASSPYQRRAGGAFEPDSGARARKPFGFAGRHAAVFRQSGHGGAVFSGAAGGGNRPHGGKNRRARALDRTWIENQESFMRGRQSSARFRRFYMLFRMDRVRKMAYNTRA